MFHIDISHLDYPEAIKQIQELYQKEISTKIEYSIDFRADHAQSKIIRDLVGLIFDYYSINYPWRGRFILIADELINNAIEHWSLEGDIDSCIIRAGKSENREFFIEFEVHDTGNGKDAKDADHMNEIKAEKMGDKNMENGVYMAKRWRWLFYITEKLVDKLSFSESPKGGLAVKIEKRISSSENTLASL
jgi:anti-sigma regulatory factor (Ser/Thr protein kinase)